MTGSGIPARAPAFWTSGSQDSGARPHPPTALSTPNGKNCGVCETLVQRPKSAHKWLCFLLADHWLSQLGSWSPTGYAVLALALGHESRLVVVTRGPRKFNALRMHVLSREAASMAILGHHSLLPLRRNRWMNPRATWDNSDHIWACSVTIRRATNIAG